MVNVWDGERLILLRGWLTSEVVNVGFYKGGGECLSWWMSEVVNVWGGECLGWWTSDFTKGVVNVWGGNRLGWWTSEVVNVWGGEHLGWWMSGWWKSYNLHLVSNLFINNIQSEPSVGWAKEDVEKKEKDPILGYADRRVWMKIIPLLMYYM